jgi:alpha-glucosidase
MIKRIFLGLFLLQGCAHIQASTERLASPDGRVRPRLKGVRRQVIDHYLPYVVPVKNAVTHDEALETMLRLVRNGGWCCVIEE